MSKASEDPRISEIRAVLDEWWTNVEATSADGMKAIQRILDRPASAAEQRPVDWPAVAEAFADEIAELNPTAPRVFFPGELVPGGMDVADSTGRYYRWNEDHKVQAYPLVSGLPTWRSQWQKAVDAAIDARAEGTAP